MPILRYFLCVGGALFALLVLADAVLPSVPLPANITSASDLPAVRIKSSRQWPERIVMDTSIPAPTPVTVAKAEQPAPISGEPNRSNPREAFAQMHAADTKRETIAAAAVEGPRAATKMSESGSKPADSRKRKAAKAHPGKPMILVAQQPHFGGFFSTW
ncbi:conserved hypothetical protein [Bradyrhizobium sp. ORS 278]|uniref:hypothetical protein n=1 Tax=Bradyrhizobium sp. (strain ORS 278) TaxID=114615 RepID=UPI0001508F74|nr:hypothetical protein [Bradyrhizobium sp. ORS 278]CAL78052.1 conserved hypothetical protein [Bradyrhizobium sp. ORS 278]